MPKKRKIKKRKPTPEEVKKILEGTDWYKYWREVGEQVALEIDALELAMVRSMNEMRHRYFR